MCETFFILAQIHTLLEKNSVYFYIHYVMQVLTCVQVNKNHVVHVYNFIFILKVGSNIINRVRVRG